MASMPSQQAESDLDALESAADAYMASRPDYTEGFLTTRSFPECFSAVYVKQIGWNEARSPEWIEFLATTLGGEKLATTRVVPV
jgi:hypothetical protein